MTEMTSSTAGRLRRLRADLKIKNGDLKVTARKLRQAQDNDRNRRATALQEELEQIKQTIKDVERTIAELMEEVSV